LTPVTAKASPDHSEGSRASQKLPHGETGPDVADPEIPPGKSWGAYAIAMLGTSKEDGGFPCATVSSEVGDGDDRESEAPSDDADVAGSVRPLQSESPSPRHPPTTCPTVDPASRAF